MKLFQNVNVTAYEQNKTHMYKGITEVNFHKIIAKFNEEKSI